MLETKVKSAAKVAELKTNLLFVDAEVKCIAALKEQKDELASSNLLNS